MNIFDYGTRACGLAAVAVASIPGGMWLTLHQGLPAGLASVAVTVSAGFGALWSWDQARSEAWKANPIHAWIFEAEQSRREVIEAKIHSLGQVVPAPVSEDERRRHARAVEESERRMRQLAIDELARRRRAVNR